MNCMDEESGGSLCREMVVLYLRQGVVGRVNGEKGQELIAMNKRKEIYNTNFTNLLIFYLIPDTYSMVIL